MDFVSYNMFYFNLVKKEKGFYIRNKVKLSLSYKIIYLKMYLNKELKKNFYINLCFRHLNLVVNENLKGMSFVIYNGKYFIPITVVRNMYNLPINNLVFTKKIKLKKPERMYKKKKKR